MNDLIEFLLKLLTKSLQVVKHFWMYVRKHNLQDPEQKSTILCDERLRAVTKRKKLESKEVFASLKKHLTDV